MLGTVSAAAKLAGVASETLRVEHEHVCADRWSFQVGTMEG